MSRSLAGGAGAVLCLSVLATAYVPTLAPGITWANDGADSGDLVTATATLGVAHPTGYPTYLLLARLFQLLPLGDLAHRSAAFSALAAALAALGLYILIHRLLEEQAPRAVSAALGALAFGLSPLLWSQAVIAEVYSLNALFAALLLLFTHDELAAWRANRLLQTDPTPTISASIGAKHILWPGVQGLMVGLGLGNHATIVLLVGVWFVVVVAVPRTNRWRVIASCTAGLGLGVLVYLYLPLRSAANPPINWGAPSNWEGFWWVVSGAPYRQLALGLPVEQVAGRVQASAALLVRQFGWPTVVLGFLGLLSGTRRARLFVWVSVAVSAAYLAFAISYNTADSYAYLIPAHLIFALWIGLGAHMLLATLTRRSSLAAWGAATLLFLLLAWRAWQIAPRVDASQDRQAIVYATALLAAAPPNALIITETDRDSFPLWYYHYALGQRPDLALLVEPLLDFPWYRHNLRATYPSLWVPDQPDLSWVEALERANPERTLVCRASVEREPPLICRPVPAHLTAPTQRPSRPGAAPAP